MPRLAVEDNSRMSLRIRAEEKAILLRAAALRRTDLTDFVRQHSLNAARAVIQEAEHLELSERDSCSATPERTRDWRRKDFSGDPRRRQQNGSWLLQPE